MIEDAEKLCQSLGYEFRQPTLLTEALTHRSASGHNNERLEFLGDSVLSVVISETLYQHYPRASEGELSRLRASLVRGTALAELARDLELGAYLQLGSGELKSGGFRRDSILADALEAIIGAIYLDAGFERCRLFLLELYRDKLLALPPVADLKDPKTRLQELLQARKQPLPVYEVLQVSGADHARSFTIECRLQQMATTANGSSRRGAEQEAARKALGLLQ